MLRMNSVSTAWWHFPHVPGTLNLKIDDLGSLAARISCAPWQSVHTAAPSLPAATARPCTLCWYDMKGWALCPLASITNFCEWHCPHVAGTFAWFTLDFGSEDANRSCTPPWQSSHVAALCSPD